MVEPGRPVGQTFRTGRDVDTVFRIMIWQAFWHETWDPDERLVLTLWDSPEKNTSYGRDVIPYDRRMWERALPNFTLDARVEPDRSYYFELTVEVEPLRPAEIPREWLLSGDRPGMAGGDGRVGAIGTAREDYPDGRAYIAGEAQDFDLWFEVHVRRPASRDALYHRAFERFDLEYPPLAQVREAVEAGDWDRAVTALVDHFEGREDLVDPDRRRPRLDAAFDTREADLAAAQRVELPDDWLLDLGPYWNHFALWPERGGVGLTRSGLRRPISNGYAHTGNEKYARAFDEMLFHFFMHCPSPLLAGIYGPDDEIPASLPSGLGGGSMWSGLSIGARMMHGFHWYTPFVESPFFTEDVRAAFIINLGEMADVLERMRGAGNWETQMADALFNFGMTYPEFKRSGDWFEMGFNTLVENALSTVRADGALREPTINYHMLVLNRYSRAMQRARHLDLDIPDEMAAIVEKMFEFLMYSVKPDGTLPLWGDSADGSRPEEMLTRGAALFNRDDMTWVGTGGRTGTVPGRRSVGFPDGGFYYMRTGWEPNAHYMGIRCGPFGSHGHFDALSVVVSAYGRPVLIDPGIHTYGTPEARELESTRSHSTVMIGDHQADSATADAWVTTEGFDFFAGRNVGYRGRRDARHHRRVWFMKPAARGPAVWLILDDLVGDGEAEARLIYRFAPGRVDEDTARAEVRTMDPEGGNLAIRLLDHGHADMLMMNQIAVWKGDLVETPGAHFVRRSDLPLHYTSLLVPYQGDRAPSLTAELLDVPDHPGARGVWIEDREDALLVLAHVPDAFEGEPVPLAVTMPDVGTLRVEGAGAAVRLIRRPAGWKPVRLHGVHARSIHWNEETIHSADAFVPSIDRTLTLSHGNRD